MITNQLLAVLAIAWAAGLAMVVGGLLARLERIRPRWLETEFRHAVIAFGGGALLAAVALVLVPEGSREHTPFAVVVLVSAGGFAFMLLDFWLESRRTPAAQLTAMLADFLPEALALGAAFAAGDRTGPLLALLIAIQNLPEGFNAYCELTERAHINGRRVLAILSAITFLGPLSAFVGLRILSSYPAGVAAVMLFSAGGILYLTFQDIAPQSKLQRHWAPPLGAVAGFLVGTVGDMLIR